MQQASLTALPLEVVAHVFGFIPSTALYPHCFLISRFCLEAVKNELEWKNRCEKELEIFQQHEDLSWFHTYRGIISTSYVFLI